MKKRLLSLLMVAAMTVSLAACGKESADDDKQKESSTPKKESSEKAEASEDVEEVDPYFGAFEETVTLSSGIQTWHTEITYAEGDDYMNNPWTRAYKERFNIEIENAFEVASSADYTERINLLMTENNLPDIFRVNRQQLEQLVEADMIWELTDIWETYASDSLKEYVPILQQSWDCGKVDGKLYGLSQMSYGNISRVFHLWIRRDWLEASGLGEPKTMDDVVELAQYFMDNFGAEYGIVERASLAASCVLADAWGAHPEIWVKDKETGEVGYGGVQPEMKEALAAFHEWYEKGIYSQDFTSMNYDSNMEDIYNGKVGITHGNSAFGFGAAGTIVTLQGEEAILDAYEIPSATGEGVEYAVTTGGGDNFLVVNKDCENPEALIKMLNFYDYVQYHMLDEEGLEAMQVLTDGSRSHCAEFWRILYPLNEQALNDTITEALKTGDTSSLVTADHWDYWNSINAYLNEDDYGKTGYVMQVGFERSAYNVSKHIMNEDRICWNAVGPFKPVTMVESGSTLWDILAEGYTKIITGAEDIDYFDTLVEQWKTAGGEQATKEANEIVKMFE